MWLITGWWHNSAFFIVTQTILATANCVAFLCGEAVVAEHSQGSETEKANKLQTWVWGSSTLGGLLGTAIGGQIEAFAGYEWVFMLSAIPPLLGIPFSWA